MTYVNICIFVCLSICILGCTNIQRPCTLLIEEGVCIPIKTYIEWNRCIANCEIIELKSKTKPYEPTPWIRPRPYAYP